MKKRKVLSVVIASVIVLSLAVTTGCGGVMGIIGCTGCLGALSSIYRRDDANPTLPTYSYDPEYPTEEPGTLVPFDPFAEPETEDGPENELKPGKPSGKVSIGDGSFVYTEYDPTDFLEGCDGLSSLAKGRDSDAIIAKYEELYNEYTYIDENESILYVAYSQDPTDEYLSDQNLKYSEITQNCSDKFLTAIRDICDGPCADEFKKYIGDDYFESFASYEPLTDEQSKLYNRVTELVDEYYTAIEEAEDENMPDSELVNIVGPIYLELVEVRTEIAKSYGYDSYADYADENIYCRDFTADQIEAFCETVKKFSSEYYDLLYTSSAYYMPFYIQSHSSISGLLSDLKTYGSKISPIASDAADMLIDRQLYSISDSSSMMDGAYTITFEKSEVPFIFAKMDGNAADFITLSHEFGHFCDATLNLKPNMLLYSYGSLELSEIHSNGLQALFTEYYDNIYDEYADAMEAYDVIEMVSQVVEGCLFDEFQREIYDNPDMTLDEVNKLYQELCKEYGDTYSSRYGGADYWWIHVAHSFESPMYYFSYAASCIVALQIWLTAQTDFDKAVDIWTDIVEAGPYAYGYMEVLDGLDVSDFTNQTVVIMTCEAALDYVKNNSGRF